MMKNEFGEELEVLNQQAFRSWREACSLLDSAPRKELRLGYTPNFVSCDIYVTERLTLITRFDPIVVCIVIRQWTRILP